MAVEISQLIPLPSQPKGWREPQPSSQERLRGSRSAVCLKTGNRKSAEGEGEEPETLIFRAPSPARPLQGNFCDFHRLPRAESSPLTSWSEDICIGGRGLWKLKEKLRWRPGRFKGGREDLPGPRPREECQSGISGCHERGYAQGSRVEAWLMILSWVLFQDKYCSTLPSLFLERGIMVRLKLGQ